MRQRFLKRLNQRGDTIVEVLIAIALVSAVLGGAFVSVNRSLQGSRRSQERGEAIKLVEGQLERLKGAADDNTKGIFPSSGPNAFCLNNTLDRQNHSLTTLPPASTDNFALYPASCRLSTDGNPGGFYHVAIQRSGNLFIATARWDRLGSGGRDEVRIEYRLYR